MNRSARVAFIPHPSSLIPQLAHSSPSSSMTMNRRHTHRPDSKDRRSFPRPPLWLNLLLLIIAAATFAYAKHHRDEIRHQTDVLFRPTPANPMELNRVREELSDMDLNKGQLSKELDSRMQYLQSLKGEEFYIAID